MDKTNTDRERTGVPYFKTLLTGLKISIKAAPLVSFLCAVANIGNAVLIGAGTLLQHRLFDSIESSIKGSGTVMAALIALLAYGGFRLLGEAVHGLDIFFNTWQWGKFQAEAARLVHNKMGKIDPVCFEDTKLQDQINKASQGAETIGSSSNMVGWMLLFYIPYFIFMRFISTHLTGR